MAGKISSDPAATAKPEGQIREYAYPNLPDRYWKKYQYASRFIKLVSSKTPKVTMYTEKAKCVLMESLTDFEMMFYDGAKLYLGEDFTKIIQTNGKCLTFESPESIKDLEPHMWKYVEQCQAHCIKVENIYSKAANIGLGEMPCFPVIIGRRPEDSSGSTMTQPQPVISSTPTDGNIQHNTEVLREQKMTISPQCTANKLNQYNVNTTGHTSNGVVQQTKRITSSTKTSQSLNTSSSSSNSSSTYSRKSGPSVVCKVFIHGVGWASEWCNGQITVEYLNGSEMSIQSYPLVICFTDSEGIKMRFTTSDQLPLFVRQKMEDLPVVMERLETTKLKTMD